MWHKCIELLVTASAAGVPLLELTTTTTTTPSTTSHRNHDEVRYGILHATVCCQVPVPYLVELAVHIFPEQVHQRCQQFGLLPLQHILLRAHPSYGGSAMTSQLVHSVVTGGRRTVARPAAVLPRAGIVPLRPASAATISVATTTTTTQHPVATFRNDDDNDEDDGNANDLLPLSFFRSTALIPFPVPNYHEYNNNSTRCYHSNWNILLPHSILIIP